jgi:hypothetical protein
MRKKRRRRREGGEEEEEGEEEGEDGSMRTFGRNPRPGTCSRFRSLRQRSQVISVSGMPTIYYVYAYRRRR